MLDRSHWLGQPIGRVAHEPTGNVATFIINHKLDAAIGSQPYCLCKEMIYRIVLIILLVMTVGCREGEKELLPKQPSFLDLVEANGEVLFVDSSPGGVMPLGEDTVYCKFLFKKENEVSFESGAYNFCNYYGKFRVVDESVIIELNSDIHGDVFFVRGEPIPIIFPVLKIVSSSDGIRLIRKDGERHLKEHWNVYEETDIFPLIQAPIPN